MPASMGDEVPKKKVGLLGVHPVSPPSGSIKETTLALTFFDVFWLILRPIQRVFFYQIPNPSTTLDVLVSDLKTSLSLALQLYYSLAGKIRHSPETGFPEIHYSEGDSVSLTVAESTADFFMLVSDAPKEAAKFHALFPILSPSSLFSVQLTLFPGCGVAIGYSLNHVAADGQSINKFMKSWSIICRTGDLSAVTSRPIFDTYAVKDPTGLKRLFIEQTANLVSNFEKMDVGSLEKPLLATFVLARSDIELLRQRLAAANGQTTERRPRLSTFVVACGYVWVCLIRARKYEDDRTVYFSFGADCRSRLDPPLPDDYFGNCIAGILANAAGKDLTGEDGLRTATEALAAALDRLKEGPLKGAENWIPTYASLAGERIVTVAGSPRFRVYDTDFGWGRPLKTEVLSIEKTGAIYMGDRREEEGAVEMGIVLPASEMNDFAESFRESLPSS